jgi:hypothetical protein
MTQYNNSYAQKIFDILSPIIGEIMAKGSLRAQCNQLGITEESIQLKDLQAISEKLRRGLIIFLGSEGSMQVASKISNL